MFKAIAVAGIALALGSAQVALAQRRPATEADALSYIYSAFLTQADPGVMGREVVLGPELQRALGLPPSTEGPKVYNALIGVAGQKSPEVRKATPQEVAEYGARRGFDRTSGALYTVEIGERKFLVQYDLERINVFFVGQLGLPDPDPRPVALKLDPAPLKVEPAQWSAQFQFDSAELSAEMRAALDNEI